MRKRLSEFLVIFGKVLTYLPKYGGSSDYLNVVKYSITSCGMSSKPTQTYFSVCDTEEWPTILEMIYRS